MEAGAPSQEIGVTLAPDGGIFFDSNPNPELGDQYTVYRARLLDAGGLADLSSVKGLESENLQRQLVFTGDGRRVYFTSTRISPNGHIYTSTRLTPEAPWSPPTLVEELASDQTDLAGSVSPNGCRIYFASNRDTTFKIYVASKR